jgi:O-antigen ligase
MLNITALSLTFARSYYVSVVVVLFLLLLLKNWKWFTFGGILFIAILVFILSFPNSINYRIQTMADPTYSSNSERIFIWKIASEMIKEHPITGVGRGGWQREVKNVYYPKYKDKHTFTDSTFVHAHNVYLSILAETGLIGLLLFFALWGGILWILVTNGLNLYRGSFDFPLIVGTVASLCNLLVAGLFEHNFETLVVLLLISFLVSISLAEFREP